MAEFFLNSYDVFQRPTWRFPFSHKGSWFSLSRHRNNVFPRGANAPLSLRFVSGKLWESPEAFHLSLSYAGRDVPFREILRPGSLRLETEHGSVTCAYQDPETLRIRCEGVSLLLNMREDRPLRLGQTGWTVRAGSMGWMLVGKLEGAWAMEKLALPLNAEAPSENWVIRLDGENQATEIILHQTKTGGLLPVASGTLDECAQLADAAFERWQSAYPQVPEEFGPLRDRELWNLWNLGVHPLGNIRREITLVSKFALAGIWSWDHCWHMLATASIDPELAWNNLMVIFDHQDVTGGLPDVIAPNEVLWAFLKPPVHGWMVGLLEARHAWFSDAHRREVYPRLCRLTEFWLRERDEDRDGVPNYLHGNDSGWDNSTAFDAGVPLEAPDLSTWLILQQDWLAKCAEKLGLMEDAVRWKRGSESLLQKMLEHFWNGERFVGRLSGSHEEVPSESLLLRIPLLLGSRLPEAAREWCLRDLRPDGAFGWKAGFLTESKTSAAFEQDGYWRGPIWPVEVFIFVEALRANDEHAEADSVVLASLRHIQAAGNFENYRADTGEGLRDPSIAWTSSCVLAFLAGIQKAEP
jgi:hypothetical protein